MSSSVSFKKAHGNSTTSLWDHAVKLRRQALLLRMKGKCMEAEQKEALATEKEEQARKKELEASRMFFRQRNDNGISLTLSGELSPDQATSEVKEHLRLANLLGSVKFFIFNITNGQHASDIKVSVETLLNNEQGVTWGHGSHDYEIVVEMTDN